jgi:hypothetical protein
MKSKGIIRLRDGEKPSFLKDASKHSRKDIEKMLKGHIESLKIENDIMAHSLETRGHYMMPARRLTADEYRELGKGGVWILSRQSKADPSEAVPSCAFQDWGNSSNVITWKWYNFRTGIGNVNAHTRNTKRILILSTTFQQPGVEG